MSKPGNKRTQFMGESPLFYKEPIYLEKGEGVWLYDKAGKKYLDVYNNVPVAGHCHPRIIASLTDQASKLNVHSRYISDVVVDYSEKLVSLHSDNLSKLQMACSGTEAVEIAIKMARIHTGGQGIICSNATYHGNSHETFRMTIGPFEPEFRRVTYPESYRPIKEGLSQEELCTLYLKEVEKQIEGFSQDGIKFAGLIFCSLFANEGLPDFPKDYLTKVSKLVRDSGGVLILDEVQAGFGRTGTWWGYQLSNVSPDIAVMGKPMGSGLPVSGVIATEEISNTFHEKAFYFNTTAATPLQAAVAGTVIDIIQDEGLIENAEKIGGYLKTELLKIKDDFDYLGDVRGPGLFIGLDIVDNKEDKNPDREKAIEIVEILKNKGVLISNAGQYRNVLKLRPPLVFDLDNANLLLETLNQVFREVG
ncbi:MAG: aspartate aminotransferase family protein [SAR86 cluster bacterium]|jgi:4-aminobutyrate aminotransferase-like enzyme|nr:aspartate aminotransferase family protein [SAR86 cluster bacterium]